MYFLRIYEWNLLPQSISLNVINILPGWQFEPYHLTTNPALPTGPRDWVIYLANMLPITTYYIQFGRVGRRREFVYELHAAVCSERGAARRWSGRKIFDPAEEARSRASAGRKCDIQADVRRRYRGQRYIVIADTLSEISAYSAWHVARAGVTDCNNYAWLSRLTF